MGVKISTREFGGDTSLHSTVYVQNLKRILNKTVTITGSWYSFYLRRIQLRKGTVLRGSSQKQYIMEPMPQTRYHILRKYNIKSLLLVVVVYILPTLISASHGLCFSDCNIPPHSLVTTIPTAGHLCYFHWMLQFLKDTDTSARYYYCFSIHFICISLFMLSNATSLGTTVSSRSLCQTTFLLHYCLHLASAKDSL